MKKTGSKSRWRWWKKWTTVCGVCTTFFFKVPSKHSIILWHCVAKFFWGWTTLLWSLLQGQIFFCFHFAAGEFQCWGIPPWCREILSGRRGTISLRRGRISRRRGRISWHKMILDIICIRKKTYKWVDFNITNLTEEARLHKVRVERYLDLLLGWICPNLFLPGPMDLKGAGSHNLQSYISHS